MEFLSVAREDLVATVTLHRGKVNALNEVMVQEIGQCFSNLEQDASVGAAVVTGAGKFFSFGFDIPEFLSYSKEDFTGYLIRFAELYTRLYLFPKPLVAALNGHTIAGGCMLALACDYRVMADGKGRISLNEITFGASVFAGIAEILRQLVGQRQAELILLSGALYDPMEAHRLGLVDEVTEEQNLMESAGEVARNFARKDAAAFKSIKHLLRRPVAATIAAGEEDSIRAFVDLWYSAATWQKLQEIKIR